MSRSIEQIEKIKKAVAAVDSWYHRIDVGDGIETPGPLRMSEYLGYYSFPERMDGMRVLDVGASNGFFAYEFERRGASEVIAVELPDWKSHDWTPRYRKNLERKEASARFRFPWEGRPKDGFDVVGEALGSTRVKRIRKPIYELTASELGRFDIVFSGAMLMHVRDPVLGIQRMRECCKPDGRLIVSVSTLLTSEEGPVARFVGEWDQCNWWQMNAACLERMLKCCDFDRIENRATYILRDTELKYEDPTFVCHAFPRSE